MKPIETGTCFVIPLTEDQFAFGYVTYATEFVVVNVFDFVASTPAEIRDAFDKPLIKKDWIVDWSLFVKIRNRPFPPWTLKRNLIIDDAPPAIQPVVIYANHVFDFERGQKLRRATDDDRTTYEQVSTYSSTIYNQQIRDCFGIDY